MPMEPDAHQPDLEPDERIASLVNEYFDRRQAGEGLTPEQFAAENPELAGELQPYLEGLALLDQIRARGVDTAFVTLHVGVGTFKPIDVEHVSRHTMHTEWYELNPEAAEAVRCCRQRRGRVVAVGTTTVRVLESAAMHPFDARTVKTSTGETCLFIHPPY